MSITFAYVEKLAVGLSDIDRARLADSLIASLPDDLIDEAELQEAVRRDREMDANPGIAISLEDLDRRMAERFAR